MLRKNRAQNITCPVYQFWNGIIGEQIPNQSFAKAEAGEFKFIKFSLASWEQIRFLLAPFNISETAIIFDVYERKRRSA